MMVVITDEQAEAWARGLRAAGVDPDGLMKVVREIAEAAVIAYMELEKVMEQVANIVWMGLAQAANELEELEAVRKKAALLELPTARDRKISREKWQALERATAARFRQYRTNESKWAAQKRTGPRRREWRGPWKKN